jgi:hypothetical protein
MGSGAGFVARRPREEPTTPAGKRLSKRFGACRLQEDEESLICNSWSPTVVKSSFLSIVFNHGELTCPCLLNESDLL